MQKESDGASAPSPAKVLFLCHAQWLADLVIQSFVLEAKEG